MTTTAPQPTQDLYRHVNGDWMENNTIPADRGTYGAFMELHDQSEIAVHDILESAAKELSRSSASIHFMLDTRMRAPNFVSVRSLRR